jgi:hypothetical protein
MTSSTLVVVALGHLAHQVLLVLQVPQDLLVLLAIWPAMFQ